MFYDIYYRKYGDRGYLLNQSTGKSYFFDESASVILEELITNHNTDIESIAAVLAKHYNMNTNEDIVNDVRNFIEQIKPLVYNNETSTETITLPEDYLQEYTFSNNILSSVMLELTYRCNEKCVHCYTCDVEKNAEKELTTDEYYAIMDSLHDFHVSELVLSGGEIGLRKDFELIYQYAVQKGFIVSLMTNGTLFSQSCIEMLVENPPKVVYISFYGASAQTHDAVTQVSGSFEKSLNTLMRLKCAGVNVCMKTVAMTCTLNDYPNIVKMAERLGVGLGTGMFITCGNNGCKTPAQYRLQKDEEYEFIVKAKQKYRKSYTPYRERVVTNAICEAGAASCLIDPYGYYHICASLTMPCGNIKETPIEEFWSKNEYLHFIRSLKFTDTECVDCEWKSECVYCVGANYVENGKLFGIQKEHCQAAHAFHNYFSMEKQYAEGG